MNRAPHRITGATAPLLLALLLVVDSLHFIFARALLPHLPPVTSAMFVLSVAAMEMFVFALIRGGISLAILIRNVWFFAAIGLLVATSTNLNYAAVAYIDPGTAALLGKTSILFGLGLSLLWLRERLTWLETVGAVVAILGVFVITFQPVDVLRYGSLMVLGSALIYELHTAMVKRYGGEMDFAHFFVFRLAATAGFLFLFAAGQGKLVWPKLPTWTLLVLAGTVDVAISRGLYYLALRRMQMSLFAIVLTLSPVASISWALLLFGEAPGLQQLVGGVGVMAGIAIVMAARIKDARAAKAIAQIASGE